MAEEETLTADSPEVVRLRNAVEAMNAAENALIEGLPGADAARAKELADAVVPTHKEFELAMVAVERASG